MGFFEIDRDSLIFRNNGETVMVTPWGDNGLRVRAVASGEIHEEKAALLEPVCCAGSIELGEREASVRNGKISARLIVNGSYMQITFLNQEGKTLLQEIPSSGALELRARHFKALSGDAYCLKASFLPADGEKIYGMGQYQQT
ncbi:MAG: glycoside hydrolase family 31 protein, partial [Oscillospiraceae bacterium]|nr:glycoside hydrolase family 31 protein [Oscillospiraceae bacterium]